MNVLTQRRFFVGEFIENESLNNFKSIRLVAAFMVIIAHSYVFTNEREDVLSQLSNGNIDLSYLGLSTFFFLSGLLVTQSLCNSSSWKNFLWKRVLRLYPAAWLSILFCMFLLGPVVSNLKPGLYFSDPLFYNYAISLSLVRINYFLPGVFTHSFNDASVNASLWSISLELKLYAGLLFFYFFKIPFNKIIIIVIILAAIIIEHFFYAETENAIRTMAGTFFQLYSYVAYAPYFLIGVLCYQYKDKLFVNSTIALLVFVIACIGIASGFFLVIRIIVIPVLVLYFSALPFKWIKKITPAPDLSYGYYVFAFPLQQVISQMSGTKNIYPWQMALLSIIVIFPFAVFSWYLVEKKALRFKKLVK